MMTEKELRVEIESIAKSAITEYEYQAIADIKEKITQLKLAEMERRNGNQDESEIESLKDEISEMIDSLTIDDLDDIQDNVMEMVDGHEFVIYYSKAWDVAYHMRGNDLAEEQFEELFRHEEGMSIDDIIQQFAFSALESNVNDQLEMALEAFKDKLRQEVV